MGCRCPADRCTREVAAWTTDLCTRTAEAIVCVGAAALARSVAPGELTLGTGTSAGRWPWSWPATVASGESRPEVPVGAAGEAIAQLVPAAREEAAVAETAAITTVSVSTAQ